MRKSGLIFVLVAAAVALAAASVSHDAPAMRFQMPQSRPLSFSPRSTEAFLPLLARGKPAPKPKNPLEKAGDILKSAAGASKNFWTAAAAGGFAGTCMFPVDTAKVRMQSCAQSEQAMAFASRTYRSTFQTIGKVAKEEGFFALYKGLLPVIIGSAPEMAVQVATYEWARDYAAKKLNKDKFAFDIQLIAGSFSGFAHVAASNPMEVLKIRGQVLGAAGGGIVGAVKEVGFKGLYKGVGACWSRDIPFSAIYFPAYALTKKKLEDKGYNPFLCSMGAGLFAGVLGAAPTTPCDVVKTRLQSPRPGAIPYKGVRDCVARMAAEEGLGSFFTGVVPRVGRVAPYLALSLTSYEIIKAAIIVAEKKAKEGTLFKFGAVDPKAKKGQAKGKGKGKK
mmetsp:Transcript_34251/g.66913  ORF Transcript_34251/g.66913 Transcript_34251/m.66913 type:complete len:392 (-) Transcript_34251:144-1319(-)|eukprot:CAMPEP_0173415892 /NCGR_PEP_ID=MMETSP1356-20130122/85096_1 /TAXON_ID=77927 ORGANISM="Hemiselmis virescens, Strain PCC157" /NCGR_SAMPLE_ID=MMETSP1356 /ASSEMBLY_ACC=CAM_ASM_000847 /LENGTH=391 /DNA_ID=CAMNT_0014378175 /DNA_START=24 /DNA_END=1199 /DNA_ORIENTATION=-